MDKDYLVFWRVAGSPRGVERTVVRVMFPPCETPVGETLRELLIDGLSTETTASHDEIVFFGGVELPSATWSHLQQLNIATHNGAMASLERSAAGWRIHG